MPALTILGNVAVPYASLILLVGLGAAAAWRRVLDRPRIAILTEVTASLLLPVFVFWTAATGSAASILGQSPWVVVMGLAVGVAGYVIASAWARLAGWDWSRRSVLQVSGTVGNTGFLGIPICTALYGSQGAILAVLYDLGASVFFMTIGLNAFQVSDSARGSPARVFLASLKQLVNPLLLALVLGLGVALAGWAVPPILRQPLEGLSNTVVPLMMLMLGGMIYDVAAQPSSWNGRVLILTLLKLFLLPGLAWLTVGLLPLPSLVRGVIVIEAAMPSAIFAVVFAERYNADKSLAASATMLTTLLSMLTVPVFAILVS